MFTPAVSFGRLGFFWFVHLVLVYFTPCWFGWLVVDQTRMLDGLKSLERKKWCSKSVSSYFDLFRLVSFALGLLHYNFWGHN